MTYVYGELNGYDLLVAAITRLTRQSGSPIRFVPRFLSLYVRVVDIARREWFGAYAQDGRIVVGVFCLRSIFCECR